MLFDKLEKSKKTPKERIISSHKHFQLFSSIRSKSYKTYIEIEEAIIVLEVSEEKSR